MQFPMLLFCVALLLACAPARAADVYVPRFQHAPPKADFSRLPELFTGDAAYDAFLNEYLMRHLSVDERGIYLGGGPILGATDHMWVIEWDQWMLPWIDRAAMGLWRQGGSDVDVVLNTLMHTPVDRFGYAWGSVNFPEPNDMLGGYRPTFGWPWPRYTRNYTVDRPTGWDFNVPAEQDASRAEWKASEFDIEAAYTNHRMAGTIRGANPELTTPAFDCDVFQIPIFEIDLEYTPPDERPADSFVQGLRVYWTTSEHPDFSEERSVGVSFCDLPPSDFPGNYGHTISKKSARYQLFFPMCLHPEWGREGRRITGLKVRLAGEGAEGVRVSLNYVRASYDVRLVTSNAILINASHRFYMWSGDRQFLAAQMPRLRRALMFLNEHLGGKKHGLIECSWFAGHDGIGGGKDGHGMIGSYWDLLPSGLYDFEASVEYFSALRAMVELEKAAAKLGIEVPDVTVIGPDDRSVLRYRETPASLASHAARVRKNIERVFWVKETGRFCRNVDAYGQQHDYGFLHFNVFALACGIGTDEQRRSILSWLDGREIPGDTSTGADIYHYRFAPRISTRRNEDYYYWAWVRDHRFEPDNPQFEWGNQMQDGGAVPFTSFFELVSRCGSGDQKQIDRAYERTREVQRWFRDVKDAGGEGRDFYRAYYDGHPERGLQQSPKPGALGLDREFLSDGSLGTVVLPFAFLGLDAQEEGVISIAPAVPSGVGKVGVRNVSYRGNHLTVEAGKHFVSLEGSRLPSAEGLRMRVTLRDVPEGWRVLAGGMPVQPKRRFTDGRVLIEAPLAAVRIHVLPAPAR